MVERVQRSAVAVGRGSGGSELKGEEAQQWSEGTWILSLDPLQGEKLPDLRRLLGAGPGSAGKHGELEKAVAALRKKSLGSRN